MTEADTYRKFVVIRSTRDLLLAVVEAKATYKHAVVHQLQSLVYAS